MAEGDKKVGPFRVSERTLSDRIKSEEGALEVHHSEREDGRMKMVLTFLGVMGAMTLIAGAIPAIGFDNAWKVMGPIIGGGLGILVNSSRRPT